MSIWNNIKKFTSQLGLTYNASGKTYNQAFTNYSGKMSSVWTKPTKN